MKPPSQALVALLAFPYLALTACLTDGTEQTINSALSAAGVNGTVQLCPKSVFTINNVVAFTADGQELSTEGYPAGADRASIIISPTNNNNLTALISGLNRNRVKILNLIVDGNRPAGWAMPSGNRASIELGSGAREATVANTASRNSRGFSCLHILEGNTAYPYGCTRANITNNDIGPCGTQQAWSHGISIACAQSSVTNNNIIGSTDAGISVFGAPETTISGNTITGSATERGFGGIALVEKTYGGNYSGVVVKNNKIIGGKMFNLGIALGPSVWYGDSGTPFLNQGPTQILDNTFSGNIVTSIAVNGWKNGLNVSGHTNTGTTKPNSLFADARAAIQGDCAGIYPTWKLFQTNVPLSWWSPGVQGQVSLDSGFVNSTYGSPTRYTCAFPALNNSISYAPGKLYATPAIPVTAFLHGSLQTQLQWDNNLVAVDYSDPDTPKAQWSSVSNQGYTCDPKAPCELVYQKDSNLVNYVGSKVIWSSGTNNGQNNTLTILNQPPWMRITDPSGAVIWDTTKLVVSVRDR